MPLSKQGVRGGWINLCNALPAPYFDNSETMARFRRKSDHAAVDVRAIWAVQIIADTIDNGSLSGEFTSPLERLVVRFLARIIVEMTPCGLWSQVSYELQKCHVPMGYTISHHVVFLDNQSHHLIDQSRH